ncbi:MAG: hypothetical protein ACE5IZ_01650 [Dehalococcoidia bacterium]
MNSGLQPTIRVSAIPLPERYQLPGRPSTSFGTVAQDAYRQTRFLLAGDLALFEQAMNLQLRIVADSSPSKYRTHALAALVGLWSRAFAYLADGCALAVRGAYVSALPPVRAACDCIAAQHQLATQEMEEFIRWLAQGIRQDREHAALEFALGRYRAGATLAAHPRLGSVYRVVSDLCLPHFGATTLQVAPESNPRRLAILFADNAFHLGWAELIIGWLLVAADVQLDVTTTQPQIFVVSDQVREEYGHLSPQMREAVESARRCRVEEIADATGGRRYLFHNFRRQAAAAPRKILL